MTITQLITKVREEKPNSFTDAKLIEYINEIEVEVAKELRYSYDDIPKYEDTAEDKALTLLAVPPYDRLYVSYLKSQIDYANEEYASYQLNALQHNQDFTDFKDWVVRAAQQVAESPTPRRFRNVF